MIILYVIEGIWSGKQALRDGVVFKMIEDLDRRESLSDFNQNQIKEVFRGFNIR